MLIYKAFRFRLYPTPAQRARLERWEFALRWLWNLANEQRELGLARCGEDRVFVHYASQNRDLTLLRNLYPWLSDVPSPLCQSVLRDLETAWRQHYRGGSRPRYKARAKDHRTAMRCDNASLFRFDSGGLEQFPKLGRIKAVLHRNIIGKAKTCALIREEDQWFVSVTCQLDVPTPAPRRAPSIGIAPIEGGLFAMSNGVVVAVPQNLQRTGVQLKRARRTALRRQKGSRRHGKARLRVARLKRRALRQLDHVLHTESRKVADSQGTVAIRIVPITVRSSTETFKARAAWFKFRSLLKYKLTWTGGRLIEIDPQQSVELRHPDGVDAAVEVLSACESLVPARGGLEPANRESVASQGRKRSRQAHNALP